MLLAEKHRAVTHETIARALKSVAWPGRFERFALEGVRIVVDGAHNPAGAAHPLRGRLFVSHRKLAASAFGEGGAP